eukprot:3936935-Rhodomonas_salina.1
MLTTPALVTQPQFFLQSTTIRSMQRQSTASRHSSHRSPKLHMQIHEEKLSCKRIFRPISVVLSSLIIASSFPHGAQSFITPPPSQLQMPGSLCCPGFLCTLFAISGTDIADPAASCWWKPRLSAHFEARFEVSPAFGPRVRNATLGSDITGGGRPRLGMAAESVVEEHVKTNSKDG